MRWLVLVAVVWGAAAAGEEQLSTTAHPQTIKLEQLKQMEESSLMGWYHMVNRFLLIIKPDHRTLDYVVNFVLGENDLTPQEFLLELARMNSAFLAMVVAGTAYALVMALSGLFFLACRCGCDRCGAKDSQRQRSSDNCWRTIHKFCLILMIAFLVVPIVCMCIINVHITQSSPSVKGNISHVFDILGEFANQTDEEVDRAATMFHENPIQNFQEFKNSFVELVQENITNSVDHEKLEDIKDIVSWIASVEEKQAAVSNASDVSKAVQHLKSSIAGVRSDVRSLYNCTNSKKQVCQVDFKTLPLENIDVQNAYSRLQREFHKLLDINFQELTSVIDQIQNNTILRNKIEEESESLRRFADETMSEDKQDVEKIKKKVKFYTDSLRKVTKVGKEKVQQTFAEANNYELYRYWAMFGLAGVLLLPVLLLSLGLVCGCSGHQKDRHPTKRSTLSNCGGSCLILAVYYFFLVSCLLMLITVVLFALGGSLQTFGCIPLYQPDFAILDEMKDKLTPFYNNSVLLGVQPSKLLNECQSDKSIIYALGVINESDPTSFEQFLKKSDVLNPENSAEIDGKLKVAIGEITSGFREKLMHFTSALNLTELRDIPAKLEELVTSSRVNVSVFVERVRSALREDLGEVDHQLDSLINDSITALYAEMDQLQNKLNGFSSSLLKIYNEADNYQVKIQDIEKSLDLVEEKLPKVIKAHLFYAVASSSGWKDMVEQIGKCFPVWVAFDISRIAACEFVVYPLNGFWFALGWALVVIVPTILFSVKLSRFYLRMKYDDDSYALGDCVESIPLDMSRAKPFSYTNPGAANWMAMEFEKYGMSHYRPEPQFTPHPNYMVHPASANQARHFHHK